MDRWVNLTLNEKIGSLIPRGYRSTLQLTTSSLKKKAILLSVVGAETYHIIRSLVALEKPKEKLLSS